MDRTFIMAVDLKVLPHLRYIVTAQMQSSYVSNHEEKSQEATRLLPDGNNNTIHNS